MTSLRHAVVTLTSREAAAQLSLSPVTVRRLCRTGTLAGVRVGHEWLIDGDAVASYAAPPGRDHRRRLPADPLLRQIDLRGGPAACGVVQSSAEEKALERAVSSGWITERAADQLAVHVLGMASAEIWGHAVLRARA